MCVETVQYLPVTSTERTTINIPRGADTSLARPGRKQARKHVRDASDFNNIETRAVIKIFFSLQGKAPKEIHAILTETLACFLPGRAKDLSAPLYWYTKIHYWPSIIFTFVSRFLLYQSFFYQFMHKI